MNFSIVTTVRNNLSMLKEVIESVKSQSGVIVEHIIVDGNSSDGTKEFLLDLDRSHFKLKSEPDDGIYDALNKGLAMCSNEIIGILHSDDLYADPRVLSDVQRLFKDGADVVYADLVYVSRSDTNRVLRQWKSGSFHPNLLPFGWMPPHPTFFYKRELLERIGCFSLKYGIAADYEHMLRFLMLSDLSIRYLPRTITKMRVGGESNKNLINIVRKSGQDYEIAKIYFAFPLGTVISKNLRKLSQLRLFS